MIFSQHKLALRHWSIPRVCIASYVTPQNVTRLFMEFFLLSRPFCFAVTFHQSNVPKKIMRIYIYIYIYIQPMQVMQFAIVIVILCLAFFEEVRTGQRFVLAIVPKQSNLL